MPEAQQIPYRPGRSRRKQYIIDRLNNGNTFPAMTVNDIAICAEIAAEFPDSITAQNDQAWTPAAWKNVVPNTIP